MRLLNVFMSQLPTDTAMAKQTSDMAMDQATTVKAVAQPTSARAMAEITTVRAVAQTKQTTALSTANTATQRFKIWEKQRKKWCHLDPSTDFKICYKKYSREYKRHRQSPYSKTATGHSEVPNSTICMKVLTQDLEAFYKCHQGQWKHIRTRRSMKQYQQLRRRLLSLNDTGIENNICNESASGDSSVILKKSRDGLCCSTQTNRLLVFWREKQTSTENCSSLCEAAQCQGELSPLASCCNITPEVFQQLLVNCTCNAASGISKYAVYCITAGICGLVVTLTSIIAACIKKFKRTKQELPLEDAGVQEAPRDPEYSTHIDLYTARPYLMKVTSVENDGDNSSRSSLYEYDNNFHNPVKYVSSCGSEESSNHNIDTQGIAPVEHQNHSNSDSAIHLNESSASSMQVTPIKDLTENEYDLSDFDDSLFNDYNNVFVTTADVHNVDDTLRLPDIASRDRSSIEAETSGAVEDPVYERVSNGSLESAKMDAMDDRVDDYSVFQNTGLERSELSGTLPRLRGNNPTFYEASSEVQVERHPAP